MVKSFFNNVPVSGISVVNLVHCYLRSNLMVKFQSLFQQVIACWLQPSKGLVNAMDSLLIYNDPYGVVLIMGAWNYPIHLTLLPVVGAIAAGNCVVIKPSEVSPASASVVANLIPKYLDQVMHTLIAFDGLENCALIRSFKVLVDICFGPCYEWDERKLQERRIRKLVIFH